MSRKHHKLQDKPLKLLSLVPSPEQKQSANPFEPSPFRMAMRRVAVKLEDWSEQFEAWCDRPSRPEAPQPLSLTHRVQKLLGWSGQTTSLTVREAAPVPERSWDIAMGEVIDRIRDRAGHMQRALMTQARELTEWMAQHTQATQHELNSLRAQVEAQDHQLENLNTQLQDLRALVSSQQKVLMYMGKELDAVQGNEDNVRALTVSPRRPGNRSKKASKSKRRAPAETGQAPYLNA